MRRTAAGGGHSLHQWHVQQVCRHRERRSIAESVPVLLRSPLLGAMEPHHMLSLRGAVQEPVAETLTFSLSLRFPCEFSILSLDKWSESRGNCCSSFTSKHPAQINSITGACSVVTALSRSNLGIMKSTVREIQNCLREHVLKFHFFP